MVYYIVRIQRLYLVKIHFLRKDLCRFFSPGMLNKLDKVLMISQKRIQLSAFANQQVLIVNFGD